eukprot:8921453-Pyramimonas_sp.AAC.1
MGKLQRGWVKLAEVPERNPSWQHARGPLSACWLTLLRINMDMVNAHTLCTDQWVTISLLTVSPVRCPPSLDRRNPEVADRSPHHSHASAAR